MSNATIDQLTRINTVYVQTIREQDARIASLETQLAAAQERERAVVELMRTIFHPDHWHNSVGAMVVAMHAALAAASEKGGAK